MSFVEANHFNRPFGPFHRFRCSEQSWQVSFHQLGLNTPYRSRKEHFCPHYREVPFIAFYSRTTFTTTGNERVEGTVVNFGLETFAEISTEKKRSFLSSRVTWIYGIYGSCSSVGKLIHFLKYVQLRVSNTLCVNAFIYPTPLKRRGGIPT